MTRELTVTRTSDSYLRKAYTDQYGHSHPAKRIKYKKKRYRIKDKGKKGRTPRRKRWFKSTVETGWKKDQPAKERRRNALKAHKSILSAARSMQALANVTTDRETKQLASADAKALYRLHKISKD